MGRGLSGLRPRFAGSARAANYHAAKATYDADERSARRTRVAFGRPLFVPAGPADHGVLLSFVFHP